MTSLAKPSQLAIGLALAVLTIATRGHHLPSLAALLPSASWAVFFLAGLYLRPAWFAGLLAGLSAGLDYAAISWGGVSPYCVSPAYAALLPAYAALWLTGRWYRSRHGLGTIAPLALAASALVGCVLCELISSGSFYVFSGRFAEPDMAGFAERLARYLPASLMSLALWVAAAAAIHAGILFRRGEPVFALGKS